MRGAVFRSRHSRRADAAAFSALIVERVTRRISSDPTLLVVAGLWRDTPVHAGLGLRCLLALAAAPELADIRASFAGSPGLWSHRGVPRTRLGRRLRAERRWHQLVARAAAASWVAVQAATDNAPGR